MSASHSMIPAPRESGIRLRSRHAATQKSDVLIIGAGPGGLATAMLLAQAGLHVRVLERNNYVGGRTSSINEMGFRFDLGPTFFHYPESLQSIFRAVGRRMEDEISLVRLDPNYRVHFGSTGTSLTCSSNIDELERAIAQIAPEDAKNIRAYLEENRQKWEVLRPVIQRKQSWRDWFTLLRHAALLRPWKSMDQDHRRFFQDERIRRAFSFQSKYLGMSPYECPAMYSFHSWIEHDPGLFHPVGGVASITEAMAKVAREMGVEIMLDAEVTQILFEGRRAVGAVTNHGEYRADSLVINADFANAMAHLVPNELRRSWSDKNLKKKRYSCSTFMMYLGVDGTFDDVAHHNLYIPDDYAKNVREIQDEHVLSEQPSFYVQNACVTDKTLAPKNKSALYVLVPTTHETGSVDWSRETARYRRLVLDQLPKVGLHDVERRIRFERIVTPQDWARDHAVYKGAVFNLAHNLSQMLARRPQNHFSELESVYLTGGGTHPGSGLFTIFESAKISSRLLLEHRGMSSAYIDQQAPQLPAPRVIPALPARRVA